MNFTSAVMVCSAVAKISFYFCSHLIVSIIRVFVLNVTRESLLLVVPAFEVPAGDLHETGTRRIEQTADILLCDVPHALVVGSAA